MYIFLEELFYQDNIIIIPVSVKQGLKCKIFQLCGESYA